MKSRDGSRASIDEKNLDAKIETERPSYTQGPCSDSACGRQNEGVVSLVPADAAPGTAVNRRVKTVQDDHTRHLDERSSDDCRTHEGRRRATTAERKRHHGTSSAWRCYTARTDHFARSQPRSPWKQGVTHWCPLGGAISVSHGIVWAASSQKSAQTPRSALHQRRSMNQESVVPY